MSVDKTYYRCLLEKHQQDINDYLRAEQMVNKANKYLARAQSMLMRAENSRKITENELERMKKKLENPATMKPETVLAELQKPLMAASKTVSFDASSEVKTSAPGPIAFVTGMPPVPSSIPPAHSASILAKPRAQPVSGSSKPPVQAVLGAKPPAPPAHSAGAIPAPPAPRAAPANPTMPSPPAHPIPAPPAPMELTFAQKRALFSKK